ncbi:histidine--tRNA ligase [Striga asiatica]|uniref:histidine--tRNA ligase n=1 Tax=Striga asiatica TaxID=4170 RepID=A0A5A7NZS6_STRAF|nr:histidine--tRNA ligase [Striga asiatica]
MDLLTIFVFLPSLSQLNTEKARANMRAATNPSFLIHHHTSIAFAVLRSIRHRIPLFPPSVVKIRAQSTSTSHAELDNTRTGRSGSLASPPANIDATQKIEVNPPKGTRDFPPEEMRLRNWLFQNFREVSQSFGFEEVDFPVLESEALFIRKAGEEIRDQLYCFEDRGNRRVALRPELTPSLARLVIQKGKSVSLPLKWFAIGQCWRYERMTRGRRREHYQWNMDIIGVPNVAAEAELISSIVTFFKRIGITASDVGFKVSSRKLHDSALVSKRLVFNRVQYIKHLRNTDMLPMYCVQVLQEVLRRYSVPEKLFGRVCVIIDKVSDNEHEVSVISIHFLLPISATSVLLFIFLPFLCLLEKIPIDDIKKELRSAELSEEAVEELLEILTMKSLTKLEEKLGASVEVLADLKQLFSLAEKYGYSEWIQFDASIVRGLAYYTGIVFEGFDREGKLRAICGGGRYDRLLSTFGGDDLPACGFGFGDAVIVELLKEKGLLPELSPQVRNIVCSLDQDLQGSASLVAARLREKGQSVDLVLENKPLKWVFKRAARINAERLIIVGNEEWQKAMKGLWSRVESGMEKVINGLINKEIERVVKEGLVKDLGDGVKESFKEIVMEGLKERVKGFTYRCGENMLSATVFTAAHFYLVE